MDPQQTQTRMSLPAENLAEVILQGTARLIDLQTAAAQALLRMQSRNAALFGAPDLSRVFSDDNRRQLTQLFNAGAQQALNLMRQTNETLSQLQSKVNGVLAQQTEQLTEQLRTSVREFEQHTRQAVEQAREASQQTAQQVLAKAEESPQQVRAGSGQAQTSLQGSGAEERRRSKRPG
jgi:gas vesicle protein